ncbi:hypothetical protein P3W45_000581 [Vairimorpha bombi]|jgi:mevalonate kinase
MKLVAKCPLKLILFGEHSVLIGSRCVSLCINRYAELYLSNIHNESICIRVQDKDNQGFYLNLVRNSLSIAKESSVTANDTGTIRIKYSLACGLGSSAAVSLLSSVAVSKINKAGDIKKIEDIYEQADKFENIFHGKSSGVDCATIRTGGLISFKKGDVESIDTVYLNTYKILIYNSRISKDTMKTVNQTLKNKKENYEKLARISEEAYHMLNRNFDLKEFYYLVRRAEDIFEDLNVVPDIMKKEVRNLRKLGIESKITGAGNGGHLFTLVGKEFDVESLKGWQCVDIDVNGLVIN